MPEEKICKDCHKPKKETVEATHWRFARSFTIGGSSTDYCDCEVATTPLHPEPDFGYFPTNNTINTQNIPPAQLPSRENNKELLNLFFWLLIPILCFAIILWTDKNESKAKNSPKRKRR